MIGDLDKYEFLTRKGLKYKPNALDKARFEISPLGKTFSTGLDKTAQGYQEEGVIKLLKDTRDGLRGGVNRLDDDRPDNNDDNDNYDDDNDDNNDNNDKTSEYQEVINYLLEEINNKKNNNDNNDDNDDDNVALDSVF